MSNDDNSSEVGADFAGPLISRNDDQAAPSDSRHRLKPEEIDVILKSHKKWIDFEGTDGARANLKRADLPQQNLEKVNLRKADLAGANFSGLILREADFREASLLEACFRESDLRGADFTDANGLSAHSFGGADLSGAKLPQSISSFDGLALVEKISTNAQNLFISLLLGCVYSWLTIATTNDLRLITNSASSPLPIIGAAIPILGFYWLAPVLLLILYFNLHLTLQRLWESLSNLPAIFPDGRSLDERGYLWLLSGLALSHIPRLRKKNLRLARLQKLAAILLIWGIVPLTLLLFWARYLTRHDWRGTTLHAALIAITIGSGMIFYNFATATLRGESRSRFRLTGAFTDARIRCFAASALIGLALILVSYGAIKGVRSDYESTLQQRKLPSLLINQNSAPDLTAGFLVKQIPRALDSLGCRPFANLTGEELSAKSTGGSNNSSNTETAPNKEEEEDNLYLFYPDLKAVKGADLAGQDMNFAVADNAFLAKADLSGQASLQWAILSYADLRGANLENARLNNAILYRATLGFAILERADLSYAILKYASLDGANLKGAVLKKADLTGALLREADLRGAITDEADFSNAIMDKNTNISGVDLSKAKGLACEKVACAIRRDTKFPKEIEDQLRKGCKCDE